MMIGTTLSRNGPAALTGRSEISADGRTMTLRQTGTDAQGRIVNNVLVSEKQ